MDRAEGASPSSCWGQPLRKALFPLTTARTRAPRLLVYLHENLENSPGFETSRGSCSDTCPRQPRHRGTAPCCCPQSRAKNRTKNLCTAREESLYSATSNPPECPVPPEPCGDPSRAATPRVSLVPPPQLYRVTLEGKNLPSPLLFWCQNQVIPSSLVS